MNPFPKNYVVKEIYFYLHHDIKFHLSLDVNRRAFTRDIPALGIKAGDLIYKINDKLNLR